MTEYIIFDLRGTKISLPNYEIDLIFNEISFLSGLLSSSNINTESINKEIYINEQPDIFLSIIDSIRHNNLIIFPTVDNDLFYKICDKWGAPEWLVQASKGKVKKKLGKLIQQFIKNELVEPEVIICKNCRIGYKPDENTNTSCNIHYGIVSVQTCSWTCCGSKPHMDSNGFKPCLSGYHVPETKFNHNHITNFIKNLPTYIVTEL
jgi:hypothetical protein